MPDSLPPDLRALEVRLGLAPDTLDEQDEARAKSILDDATVLVLEEVSDAVAARWRTDAPPVVSVVILKAARREFENPRGLASEALGEHSVGISETSGVYLTAREIAQIRRRATGRRGGFVGTVRIPSGYGAVDGFTRGTDYAKAEQW